MGDVVKKLADEKGLDLVVDTSTTLFFKPALDLTTDAIAAYNKAYPVEAAPANPAAAPAKPAAAPAGK
jgi:outer membrane protein